MQFVRGGLDLRLVNGFGVDFGFSRRNVRAGSTATAAAATASAPPLCALLLRFLRVMRRLGRGVRLRRREVVFDPFRFRLRWTLLVRRAFVALPVTIAAVANFAHLLIRAAGSLFQLVGLFLVFELQEVRYIEESVALKSDVDKRRLHAWQHA